MIWFWLGKFVRILGQLLSKPDPAKLALIDINQKCPVCGHKNGDLAAVDAMAGQKRIVACEHTCGICGARWFEEPVSSLESVIASTKGYKNAIDPGFLEKAVTSRGESVKVLREGVQ